MIRAEKMGNRTNNEDSLIKQFNQVRKSSKGDNIKNANKEIQDKFSARITMYNRVRDKINSLKKPIRPVYRSRPNDKVVVQLHTEIEQKEEELIDYIDTTME
eukprot:CAMPEP_0116910528 /NCGR_PEP_ID=MMETSP0467-20121206/14933_1 /TAXON_ID=283647 /ORGANISM="Mesodinium pulex, Strain SPMC105" /LENGTH=101 /DNA_ID=CAMNT_0004586111 /DNA_START=1629 /DNA_END=1934 /DNA_ORIENTATION=+